MNNQLITIHLQSTFAQNQLEMEWLGNENLNLGEKIPEYESCSWDL